MSLPKSSIEQSPPSSSRELACAVLIEAVRSEEGLDVLMDRALTRVSLDGRDRALAMEIAYGVMRRLRTIDWRLGPVLDKPLARLPIAVQMLLRVGAYQLLFLDRIPPSAAVSESVKLAKAQQRKLKKRDWSGLVNAVLRSLMRIPAPPWPSREHHAEEALAVKYSVPEWLSARWLHRWGLERAEAVCEQTSSIPPVTLRVNRLQISRDEYLDGLGKAGILAAPTRISPVGITLKEGLPIASLPGFTLGQFYIEDEAAQLIPPLLNVQPGDVILDACAAPGGKATHLAELMHDRGRIYAVDRSEVRLRMLEANARRLGHTSVVPVAGDLRRPLSLQTRIERLAPHGGPAFDRILVDAPCSGLGVLRRHPEAKWQKRSGQFERHHAVQLQILESSALCLRPGGVLVYSTCSTEVEENEDVIDQFLRSHAEFRRESVVPWIPEGGQHLVTERGDLSTVANQHSMDMFYAARLRHAS